MDNPDDDNNWEKEAEAIRNDLKNHVWEVLISSTLPSSRSAIYLNVETLERKQYCVELSSNGFKIIGDKYDDTELVNGTVYETPQSLLSAISPKYSESFCEELRSKLSSLSREEDMSL